MIITMCWIYVGMNTNRMAALKEQGVADRGFSEAQRLISPEALAPPNGCWATMEPVDLSLT